MENTGDIVIFKKQKTLTNDIDLYNPNFIETTFEEKGKVTILIPYGVEDITFPLSEYFQDIKTVLLPETLKVIRGELLENIKLETIAIPDSVEKIERVNSFLRPCIYHVKISDKLEHSQNFYKKFGDISTITIENHGTSKHDKPGHHVGAINILRDLEEQEIYPRSIIISGVPLTREEMIEAKSLFPYKDIINCPKQKLTINDKDWLIHEGILYRYYGFGKSITIPEGVERILPTFQSKQLKNSNALGIEHIVLPKSVTTIDACAFASTSLKSIEIPQGIKVIGSKAFAYTSIKEFVFPKELEEIESDVFGYSLLENIIFYSSSYKSLPVYISFLNETPHKIKTITIINDDGNAFNFYRELSKANLMDIKKIVFIGLDLNFKERMYISLSYYGQKDKLKRVKVICQKQLDEKLYKIAIDDIRDDEIKDLLEQINEILVSMELQQAKQIISYVYNLLEEYQMSLNDEEPDFLEETPLTLTVKKTTPNFLKSQLLYRLEFLLNRLKKLSEKQDNELLKQYLQILNERPRMPECLDTLEDKLRYIAFIKEKWHCRVFHENIKNDLIKESHGDYKSIEYLLEDAPSIDASSTYSIEKKIEESFEKSRSLDSLLSSITGEQNDSIWICLEQIKRYISTLDIENRTKYEKQIEALKNDAITIINIYPLEEHQLRLIEKIKRILDGLLQLDMPKIRRIKIQEELKPSIEYIENGKKLPLNGPILSIVCDIEILLNNENIPQEKKEIGKEEVVKILNKWLYILNNFNDEKVLELLNTPNASIPGFMPNNWDSHFDEVTILILLILKDLSKIKIKLESYIRDKNTIKRYQIKPQSELK